MSRISRFFVLALAGLVVVPCVMARQFKKPTYYRVAPKNAIPWAVVSADFNHDGNLDLAVSDLGVSQVTVLLGDGKGVFHQAGKFSVPAPGAMAVGDFNGDHIPDLAIIEWGGTGYSSLTIFLGKGDGTFKNSFTHQVGIQATSVAVADFNGDGRLDVAVANADYDSKDGNVMVFFGKGDGTFKKPAVYNLPAPYGIAAGDLNGDHHPDLVATGWNDSTVAILMNTGRGKFEHTATYSLGNTLEPNSVVIGNLVRGGHADLVVSDGSQGISVLLGNGDGTFGNPTFYSTRGVGGNGPQASVIADFNHDGKLDIATILFQKNSALFYGNGDGTFQTAVPIKLPSGGMSLALGDFDRNGAPDLAFVFQDAAKIAVLLNTQ
jgi:hypothetical protein